MVKPWLFYCPKVQFGRSLWRSTGFTPSSYIVVKFEYEQGGHYENPQGTSGIGDFFGIFRFGSSNIFT
jgi:hypothetical protein